MGKGKGKASESLTNCSRSAWTLFFMALTSRLLMWMVSSDFASMRVRVRVRVRVRMRVRVRVRPVRVKVGVDRIHRSNGESTSPCST